MGGFENAPAYLFEDKLYPWFEPLKGDCKVEYLNCASRMLQLIIEFTCPIVCDNETTWKLFEFNITGANPLQSIGDFPVMTGAEKMCTMKMKDTLVTSGPNTRVILDDAGLTSPLVELEVLTGSFLELATGIQYCMQVYDNSTKAESVVSIYRFNLEGTEPFMVSLPFENLPYCEYFLKKVSCQWVAEAGDCAYTLWRKN